MQDLSCFGLVWFSHELLICKILSTARLKAAFQSLPCLGKSVTGERAQSRGRGAPLFVLVICSPKSSQRSNNSVCLLCLSLRPLLLSWGKAGLQAAPEKAGYLPQMPPSSDRFALAAFHRAQEKPSRQQMWRFSFHFFRRIFFFLLGRISQSPKIRYVAFVSHEMHPPRLWKCCSLLIPAQGLWERCKGRCQGFRVDLEMGTSSPACPVTLG